MKLNRAGLMHVPLHPIIVHFPLALTFILPFLILIFALMIKKNKMSHQAWLIIIGLQVLTTSTGYISLESGEEAEEVAEKVVDKKLIHEHEERAEVFVGSTVLALVISVAAFFLRKEIQFFVKLAVCLVSFLSCFLAYRTGESGGELVYRYGAASAYAQQLDGGNEGNSLLPTPGMNTSESSRPVDENESLKADENDYGKSDEEETVDDEDSKLED
jgi:uncharacterized membrane protein